MALGVLLMTPIIGLVEYCQESGWFLKIHPPERLNSVTVAGSQLVSTLLGTASVAAAALCAVQTDILLVLKQKFRLSSASARVTVAIARSHKHSKIFGRGNS
jgi:cobalt-precorrin 5A hydrolase